jgi:RNA polymerase sigma-70 factor (ECF subfamily)
MKTSPKIQREVIESCQAGDERAFAEIVLHRQKRVFNIAYRMLGNLEEAKDLAQEVFISVFESIKNLKEEVKFDAWLTQITLNHCRNRWKYLKRRHYFNSDSLDDPIETEDGDMPKAIYDPSDNPEALFEKKMIQQLIQGGLQKLKEDQRELCAERPSGIFLKRWVNGLAFPRDNQVKTPQGKNGSEAGIREVGSLEKGGGSMDCEKVRDQVFLLVGKGVDAR